MPDFVLLPCHLEVEGFIQTDGLNGAQAAARYVGATSSGAPGSGTFLTGDWVTTRDGSVFICTSGGTPGTWGAVGSGASPANDFWQPSDDGLLLANGDPATAQGSCSFIVGKITLSRLIMRSSVTISDLLVMWDPGSYTAAGSLFLGIYDSTGTLARATASLTSLFTSDSSGAGTGRITAPLTSPVTLTAAGSPYLIGFLPDTSWTNAPFLAGYVSSGIVGSEMNWDEPASFRCGFYGSGLSTLPGSITLASVTDPTFAGGPLGVGQFWAGGK